MAIDTGMIIDHASLRLSGDEVRYRL